MRPRNEALYSAIKDYVSTATAFMVNRMKENDSLSDTDETDFLLVKLFLEKELSSLHEYRRCLEVLQADPKIMGQLDVLVGTSSRASRAPTVEKLMTRLLDLSMPRGGQMFDQNYFEHEYATFEEAFYGDYILYDVVVPLEGLVAHGSVELTGDFEISPFTNDDIAPYYIYNDRLEHHESMGRPVAVRTKFRLPKVVESDSEHSLEGLDAETRGAERLRRNEADRAEQARLNERIEEVINALRIFGAESVFHVGIIHRASKWFGSDNVFPNPVQTAVRFTTQTEEGWLSSFGQFWDGLQSEKIRGRKFLGLAMRRIGYAHERHRIEDKLIDLLIAAEALFLGDVGSETYRGELQFRLAQRAGLFLGSDSTKRAKINRHMKDAYKLRSQVVHGGKIRPIKNEDGSLVDMQEFVETTKIYLRDALHKMINLGMQGESSSQLINWDDLIFGVSSEKRQS